MAHFIEVRLVLRHGDAAALQQQREQYATKEVNHTWPSSFFGFIAIPNAANAYNPMVRDLLKSLYSDPLFIKALK